MANRVLLGKRDNTYGIWISKPGEDVLTATDEKLLFTMNRQPFMIIGRGTLTPFSGTNQHRYVTIPNLGYKPIFLVKCVRYDISIHYESATSVRLTSAKQAESYYWSSDGGVAYAYANASMNP